VFVILTREAGSAIAQVHDRMPVILPDQICEEWVSPTADAGWIMRQAIEELAFRAV